jgi:hypothetical protein
MLCRGLLYVVCWYVGVLPLKVGSCGRSRPQDVDFALRRSCLVVKITMYMHTCAPFSYLRFRHLGFVVGTVRQVFLHSANDLLVPPLGLPLGRTSAAARSGPWPRARPTPRPLGATFGLSTTATRTGAVRPRQPAARDSSDLLRSPLISPDLP